MTKAQYNVNNFECIQSIIIKDGGNVTTQYWYKPLSGEPKKISKTKWFKMYDLIPRNDVKLLPPITKER